MQLDYKQNFHSENHCMAEGYLKPSLVLRSDTLAGQFFDCVFGPVRWKGDLVSPRFHMEKERWITMTTEQGKVWRMRGE